MNACPSRSLALHCYVGWAGSPGSLQAGIRNVESLNPGYLLQDLHYLASAPSNVKSLMMEAEESIPPLAQNANMFHSCAESRTGHLHPVRILRHVVSLGGRPGHRRKMNGETAMRVIGTDAEIGMELIGTDAEIRIGTDGVTETLNQSETRTAIGIDEEVVNARQIQVAKGVTVVITDESYSLCVVLYSELLPTILFCFSLQLMNANRPWITVITLFNSRPRCPFTSTFMRYTVFLGAPPPSTTSALGDDDESFQWRTIASTTRAAAKDMIIEKFPANSSEFDAASRHVSTTYENIIFGEEDENEGDTQAVEENLMRNRPGEIPGPA
jgi:hypothetical protein